MERKDFLKTCGFACLGGTLLSGLLTSCHSAKLISGDIAGSDIVVPVSSFVTKDKSFRKYIVVHNDLLDFPICLYRFNESEYSALLMKCTHQGAELEVFGDRLVCPAHNSEFNNKGAVQNGPAETDLRKFPVTIQNEQIKISLK